VSEKLTQEDLKEVLARAASLLPSERPGSLFEAKALPKAEKLAHNKPMKVAWVFIGLLAACSVAVFSQGNVRDHRVPENVRDHRTQITTFSYQIFDVREAAPPIAVGSSAGGGAFARPGTTTRIAATLPATTIQRAGKEFESLCNTLGSQGFQLAHVCPNGTGFRAIFERENPGAPRPQGQ
jgi:hypothetical protein